ARRGVRRGATTLRGHGPARARPPRWGAVRHASPAGGPPPLTAMKTGSGSGTVTSSPPGISCGTSCSATYAPGTDVTLSATPAAGSSFAGWTGACTGTGSCQVSMDAARSVTATFNTTAYRSLSIGVVSLAEGISGFRTAAFAVKLSAAATTSVTVKYATANGSAVAGSDYTAASGTLTFAPGETSKTVSVSVHGDTTIEADETFKVVLSGASVPISRSVGTATIRNDDFPALSVADVPGRQGNAPGGSPVFPVTPPAPPPQTVSAHSAPANGTAKAGSDYPATAGNLTFPPGTTSRTVAVAIVGDAGLEPDET